MFGNGQYHTFDSKWYRFDGHCQYTLVKVSGCKLVAKLPFFHKDSFSSKYPDLYYVQYTSKILKCCKNSTQQVKNIFNL